MPIKFTISEKDFVNSAKLSSQASKKQFIVMLLVGLLLLMLAVFDDQNLRFISIFGIIGGIVGYFVTVFLVCAIKAKLNYRKYKRIHKPVRFAFQKDGYRI